MEQDLTQGSISKVLLRFVLPFLGASILQFLYSVVDMIIVGQFADAAAISAVNTSGQIMQLITGLISGIATGGTVLIGQHVGAKRYPSVSSVAQALLALCLGLGVLLTVVFLAGNHFIISIMQVPAAAVLPAQDYLRITSLGILFIAGYNGISAILRGLGDSKRPMYFVGCSCILNIFGDLLLVGGFRMAPPVPHWQPCFLKQLPVFWLCCFSFAERCRSHFPAILGRHSLRSWGRCSTLAFPWLHRMCW